MTSDATVQLWTHNHALLTIDGHATELTSPGQTVRATVVEKLREVAPITALIDDRTSDEWLRLTVTSDGAVRTEHVPPPPNSPPPPAAPARADTTAPLAISAEPRRSFLHVTAPPQPATRSWRGLVNRVGIQITPGRAEQGERADALTVAQHWPGVRTIAVVNGKGGASKTPTTAMLAAIFSRYGGAGVLAWDANQTRGTLGWRTEQGPHTSTVLDLLPAAPDLLSATARAADLARYVHYQVVDKYDVLRSQPLALASQQRLSAHDVDTVHAITAKYYRLVLVDTGNDESDPTWTRIVDHADQIIVATTTRDDHAEAGALLLEALAERDERGAHLARQAVVIVNQADRAATRQLRSVAAAFSPLVRAATTIPYDPAMVEGWLSIGALRPATQRAWLTAAAAVATGLATPTPPDTQHG